MGYQITRPLAGIQLWLQDDFPGGATGIGGTGHAAHQRAVGQAGKGAGLDGGSADVLM